MATQVPLYLERRELTNAGGYVGRFLVSDVEGHPQAQAGTIALNLEFFADESMATDPPAHWIAMTALMRTTTQPSQTVGTVNVDHIQRPPFPPVPMNRQTSVQWPWQLLPADVELVERRRTTADPSAPIYFQIDVRGIVHTPDGAFGVNGGGQVKIELSQWQRLLKAIGTPSARLVLPRWRQRPWLIALGMKRLDG